MKTYFKPIKLSKAQQKKADIAWHDAVCERENNTCQSCKRNLPRNMVCGHHIKPKSTHPELRHDVGNGACVCDCMPTFCHTRIEKGEIKI